MNATRWTADSSEVDELLADLKHRDPAAYQRGQALLEARDQRQRLLASLGYKRQAKGLSQTLVAARMGTSQSAVALLEGALSDPRLSTLQRYANAIDCDLKIDLR